MDNKTFIDELSRRADLSRDTVITMIEAIGEAIGRASAELDTVAIANFGVFESKMRKERVAVHPASGKKLLVPPRIVMSFKMSPALKQKINNGK